MADHLEEIPLFPLHAVLFPYARIQLHIFEERYREMIKYCDEYELPFGVVLIRAGEEVGGNPEPYLVGTTARIDKVHRYPDGRFHISARGERRFRVRRTDETTHPFVMGMVEPVVEAASEEPNRLNALCMRAIEVFSGLVQGIISRPDFNVEVQLPEDPMALSFLVANFLELDNQTKQRMIEMTDTAERLKILVPLIEKQIVEANTRPLQKLTSEDLSEWVTPN